MVAPSKATELPNLSSAAASLAVSFAAWLQSPLESRVNTRTAPESALVLLSSSSGIPTTASLPTTVAEKPNFVVVAAVSFALSAICQSWYLSIVESSGSAQLNITWVSPASVDSSVGLAGGFGCADVFNGLAYQESAAASINAAAMASLRNRELGRIIVVLYNSCISGTYDRTGKPRGGLVCLNSAARFDKWNRAAVR